MRAEIGGSAQFLLTGLSSIYLILSLRAV